MTRHEVALTRGYTARQHLAWRSGAGDRPAPSPEQEDAWRRRAYTAIVGPLPSTVPFVDPEARSGAEAANFVTGADGAFARRVLAALNARDVFVRIPGVAPLDRCIRVTDADIAVLAAALPEALAAARATG